MPVLETILEKKEKYLRKIVRHFPYYITPNGLTMARLALLPLIIYLVIAGNYGWALAFFIFAFSLDLFDGPLARHRKQETVYGALLDPLADKILFVTILIMIAVNNIPWYVIVTMVFLEVSIMILAGVFAPIAKKKNLKVKIGANKYGKYKMFFQIIGLVSLMVSPSSDSSRDLAILFFSTAILFAGMSIGEHIRSVEK